MKKLSEIEDTIIWNTPVKEEYTENITLNIKQSLLLKNNVNLLEFFLLREIDKVNNKETTSAKYFYEQFPALFRNRRQVKSILDLLSEDEYLTKTEDRYISGQITVAYALTKTSVRANWAVIVLPNTTNLATASVIPRDCDTALVVR